jgi:Tol biopolymer transport system component
MRRMGFRLTVLVLGVFAVGASMADSGARAWVPGANGDILYTSSEGTGGSSGYWLGSPHVWVIRPDGTNKRQLTTGNDAWPSWSPDGQKIVFARQTPENDSYVWRIFAMNPNGSGQHPLTPVTPGTDPNRGDNMPRFSPDGTKIAFIKTIPNSDPSRPPNAQIWVMNADGSNQHVLTDLAPTHIYAVGWAPFGQTIFFIANTLAGYCQSPGCRTFYQVTLAGSAPVALPLQPPHRNPNPSYGWWDSFDYAQRALVWGADTDWYQPPGSDVDVPGDYKIWAAADLGTTTGTETSLVGDHPSFAPDSITGDLAFVGCTGGTRGHAVGNCNYQVSVGNLAGGPSRQLTFDASNHYSPSWGPQTSRLVLGTHVLVLEARPQLGSPTIPVLIHCRDNTGRPCSFKLRVMTGSTGGKSGSMTFRSKPGANRIVRLRLPHGAHAGARITIQLRTTIHGRTSLSHVTSRVLQHSSMSAQCPAPSAQVGSQVTLAGKLSDAAPVRQRVIVVASSSDGRGVVVRGTTAKGGSYSAAFTPDTPGLWKLQAEWPGDAKHPFTVSRTCELMVPTPPPVKTQLAISCPSSSPFKVPLQITGAINPSFGGAQITLVYSHVRKDLPTEKLMTTVTTSSKGAYSDGSVAPDDPGEWDVTAFYAGDAADQASTSKTCAVAVG